MENPYASPTPSPFSDAAGAPQKMPEGQRVRGMVGHVRVLGILMIVQGILVLIMAVFLGVMAGVFPFLSTINPNQPPPPPGMIPMMIGIYGGMAAVGLICGVLNCWGGLQVMRFRQRTLGIIAVSAGATAILTCYCGFTAVALLVYGLIVLLDSSVKQAFEFGQQGYKPDQIDAMFNPWAQPSAWAAPPGGPTPL